MINKYELNLRHPKIQGMKKAVTFMALDYFIAAYIAAKYFPMWDHVSLKIISNTGMRPPHYGR
jgi:hypothetical protein